MLDQISGHHVKNIIFAPLNNKIFSVGAGLATIKNKDIQYILYSGVRKQ